MLSNILVINEKNIEDSVSTDELITAVEKAYAIQNSQDTYIPDRPHLDYKGNTLLLMPGFTEKVFGTKLVTLFPENIEKNIPVLSGIMILNDSETGYPKAFLNGSKLTAMRTGAVGAAAVKHLAKKDSETLGVIGAGVQAFHQILISYKQRNFKRILISDSHFLYAEDLKKKISKQIQNVNIETVKEPNQLIKESDVIITATSSDTPVFDLDLSEIQGKCFIGIGSYKPEMQEFPTDCLRHFDKIFTDTPFAAEETGDIKIPLREQIISLNDIKLFSEIINGTIKADTEKLNFFKSVGMSLFDLRVAEAIYNNALEMNHGQKIKL